MSTLWADFLRLFYPHLCRVCNKTLVAGEEQICLPCLTDLPKVSFNHKAGNPLELLFADKKIERAATLYYYEKGGAVQKLIHSLKYHDNKQLGFLLGRRLALDLQYGQSELCMADMLLPVPLHPKRMRQRGYNQSEWIARGMGQVLQIPVEPALLQRRRKSQTQTDKSVYGRWENVQNIFFTPNAGALQNKHILLVDDVITTGATVKACIDTLARIPGIRISPLSLAFVSG